MEQPEWADLLDERTKGMPDTPSYFRIPPAQYEAEDNWFPRVTHKVLLLMESGRAASLHYSGVPCILASVPGLRAVLMPDEEGSFLHCVCGPHTAEVEAVQVGRLVGDLGDS